MIATYQTRITFLTAASAQQDTGSQDLTATVIDRGDSMVLDIPKQPGSEAYLISGKRVDHYFAGVDELTDAKPVDVVARWALLGDRYVGLWREKGEEWLIAFSPAKRAAVKPVRPRS